jgi:hypothetical protein
MRLLFVSQHIAPLTFVAVLGTALLASCGTSQPSLPSPEACEAPPKARGFQLADSLALVGRFDLVMVTTNWPSRRITRAELQLWPNPPSRHQRLLQFGHFKGARPIAGAATYPDGRPYSGAPGEHTSMENPATELLDSTLYLGSPDPTDAIYTALRIEQISPEGFWGRFDSSDGFQMTIDSSGQRLPEAAGVFCAVRSSKT